MAPRRDSCDIMKSRGQRAAFRSLVNDPRASVMHCASRARHPDQSQEDSGFRRRTVLITRLLIIEISAGLLNIALLSPGNDEFLINAVGYLYSSIPPVSLGKIASVVDFSKLPRMFDCYSSGRIDTDTGGLQVCWNIDS